MSTDSIKHKCDHCDYESCRLSNIKRHMVRNHKNNIVQNVHVDNPNIHFDNPNIHFNNPNIHFDNPNVHFLEENNESENICNECNKTFSTKPNLLKHSKICKGIIDSKTCHWCSRIFSSCSSKCNHIKICKVKKDVETKELISFSNEANGTINAGPSNAVHSELTQNAKVINNTTNSNNNNSNNTVINNIIVFDPKNMELLSDHINKADLQEIVKSTDFSKTLTDYSAALLSRAENQCVRKTNLNSTSSAIYVGDNRWEYQTDKYIYPKLLSKIANNLSDVKENLKVRVYEQLDTFIDDVMSEATDCYDTKSKERELQKLYKKLFNNIKHIVFNITKKTVE